MKIGVPMNRVKLDYVVIAAYSPTMKIIQVSHIGLRRSVAKLELTKRNEKKYLQCAKKLTYSQLNVLLWTIKRKNKEM